jgi:uncharacterized protein YecE (DUF72 family)
VQLFVGTSGFAYPAWRGSFYPEALPLPKMLGYYAERLPAVEINNTFYRMPKPGLLGGWASQVPEGFRFALKASRRITHLKRLADVGEELSYLYAAASALGPRRGPILFQLPPFLRKDLPRLQGFLAALPDDHRAAFEFRHPSWFEDDVITALREREAALCIAESGEASDAPLAITADFGYLRLRRERYDDTDLERWVRQVRLQPWERAFVFFKHEDAGAGPALAARFQSLVEARTPQAARPRAAAATPKRAS